MILRVQPSIPKGLVRIPPSKSHSIRAVFLASLAGGVSRITNRLKSADVDSAIDACGAMGAKIEERGRLLTIVGTGGEVNPLKGRIDVGNSGTTARFILSMASLSKKWVTITGDESTRKRPMKPLLDALTSLGAVIEEGSGGFLPVRLHGPATGGRAEVSGTTSQFLSSLLLHAPLYKKETLLTLNELNEKPYVDMTLGWLNKLSLKYERNGYSEFKIEPNQKVEPFDAEIPADFSSATFFLALSSIKGTDVGLQGLDMDDTQGDKEIIGHLKRMGADIELDEKISVRGGTLKGKQLDLNSMPDSLPAMAVVGALSEGTTRLTNVPQARIKETDRISVMAGELKKMGADITEEEDGLLIRESNLKGAELNGHGDHRVVMSLAVAALAAEGESAISTAESINVTFPNFVELMNSCGAKMEIV